MNEWKLRNDVGCWDIQHPPQASFSSSLAAQCSLCLLSPVSPAPAPAPAVVCPPDTRARTPESWWYLAAASPPAAASLASAEEWGGQPGILARLEAAATVTVPGERSVWRRGGRTPEHGGGETSPAGGKLFRIIHGHLGSSHSDPINDCSRYLERKNIPSKSDVYWVQKSLSTFYSILIFMGPNTDSGHKPWL